MRLTVTLTAALMMMSSDFAGLLFTGGVIFRLCVTVFRERLSAGDDVEIGVLVEVVLAKSVVLVDVSLVGSGADVVLVSGALVVESLVWVVSVVVVICCVVPAMVVLTWVVSILVVSTSVELTVLLLCGTSLMVVLSCKAVVVFVLGCVAREVMSVVGVTFVVLVSVCVRVSVVTCVRLMGVVTTFVVCGASLVDDSFVLSVSGVCVAVGVLDEDVVANGDVVFAVVVGDGVVVDVMLLGAVLAGTVYVFGIDV